MDELVRRCQSGELAAFEEVVRLFQRRVFTLVSQYVSGAEADDVTQEVFVKVWRSIGRFRFESKFDTWLYRITVNRCYDQLRSRRRSETVPIDETGAADGRPLLDLSPLPDRTAERGETSQRVHEALGRLSAEHRAALALRDLDDRSYEEIARILDVAVGTVKSRIFRARAEFRRWYRPEG